MITKKPFYKLVEVSCEKKDCDETFSIVILSIYTVVNKAVGEKQCTPFKQNEIAKANKIVDSLDIKCTCGLDQKVYLKEKEHP